MVAEAGGHECVVKLLLQTGKLEVNGTTYCRTTALDEASCFSQTVRGPARAEEYANTNKLLLEAGALRSRWLE